MAHLNLNRIDLAFGHHLVVRQLSLSLETGRIGCLLGPSGCGKTTVLRCIAGFERLAAGEIRLDGTLVSTPAQTLPPERRRIGMVFQDYALFPHLSVADNIAFGLRGIDATARQARVEELLVLVGLGDQGHKFPHEMSGGQQQRVALARALAMEPKVLLLDEPLSNLDAKLRLEVRIEIRELQQKLGLTTIMVTHDQEEALTMADRLVVMEKGQVRQIGTQRELYEKPADRFVAGFIGRSAFIEGQVTGQGRFRTAGGLDIACTAAAVTGLATLALRPERIAVGAEAEGLANRFPARIEHASYLGALLDVQVALNEQDRMLLQIPNKVGLAEPHVGETITIGWAESAGLVYPQGA